MLIRTTLDRAMASARHMKELRVADVTSAELGSADIHAIVEGYRGLSPAVVMMPAKIDRDASLHAARIAATGFGCDVIALTTESWHPAKTEEEDYSLYNPVTGERTTFEKAKNEEANVWGPGSMQDAVENHGALEKGWIVEALMTMVVNRAGDLATGMQSYKVTRHTNALGITSASIEWIDEEPRVLNTREKGAQSSGVVPEAMVHFMNEPPLDVVMAKQGITADLFGLTAEQARAHSDCAIVKFLLGQAGYEGAVMLSADNKERSEVIERSLGNHPSLIAKNLEDLEE